MFKDDWEREVTCEVDAQVRGPTGKVDTLVQHVTPLSLYFVQAILGPGLWSVR